MPKTAAPVRGRMVRAASAPTLTTEGLVTAVVAVTGTVDDVEDLIVPGAFAATLKWIRPKVVHSHDWKTDLGRVLHVEELLPGDKRLPKTGPGGKPWPAEAGALVATMQFNLRTQRGREAFEMVQFYAESGEACFSIGYRVVPTRVTKRADGVRVIYELRLYEVSPVLFGAHPMTMALEVKAAAGHDEHDAIETKAVRTTALPAGQEEKSMHGTSAGTVTAPTLGAAQQLPPRPRRGRVNGKAAAAVAFARERIAAPEVKSGGWDKNRGNAENLRKWFVSGAGAAEIGWGTPGDFMRCVAIAGQHMSAEDAKGYCNLRHHDALGMYPATHAAMEGKTAASVVEQTRTAPPPARLEMKMASAHMLGSYEERQALVREAVAAMLHPPAEQGPAGPGPEWVCVDAMFDDRVIVSTCVDGEDVTYEVPYTLSDAGVALGEPRPVDLAVVAVSTGEAPAVEPEPVDVAEARYVTPALDGLKVAAGRLERAGLEGKDLTRAVRVGVVELLDALARKGADVAGMILGDDEDDLDNLDDDYDGDEEFEDGTGDEPDEDATPPAAPGDADTGPERDEVAEEALDEQDAAALEEKDLVMVDADEIAAQLAELQTPALEPL